MRAQPGEVLHFSEDPTITRFVPHIAKTAHSDHPAYVWAVDAPRCPDYWFPRQCPRAMAWVGPRTTDHDQLRLIGPGSERVHAIEYGWVDAITNAELYAYRFSAADFTAMAGPEAVPAAHVSTSEVVSLGAPARVGDLWALYEEAGIQTRILPSLQEFWAEVITSTLEFSGIRLRNQGSTPATVEIPA